MKKTLKYEFSVEWTVKARGIAQALDFSHIDLERIACIKTYGSKSRRTIARISGLSKVFQLALKTKSFYVIELLAEKFDKLSGEDKTKTLIHELMHIPACFGGGFRHHRPFVTEKLVEAEFRRLQERLNTV